MAVSENDLIVGPLVLASGVSVISLDFYFELEEWLDVYKSGSETPLVLGVDYTTSGEGTSSGSVTLTTAANGTDSYSVYLTVPLERSSDMQLRGEFKSGPFNLELDRVWQAMQGMLTRINRTVSLKRSSTAAAPTIPDPDTGKVLIWDVDGNFKNASYDPGDISLDVDAAQAARDAAEAHRDLAEKYAEEDEDFQVEAGTYSAKHHAAKASADRILSEAARTASEAARDASEDAVQYNYLVDDGAGLAALTGMVANERAYVRDTDHVWKYDGAAWQDQGLSVTSAKLDKAIFEGVFRMGVNTFNKDTHVTEGELVNNSDGLIVAVSGWAWASIPITDTESYITVTKGQSNVSTNDDVLHFMDSGGTRLSYSTALTAPIPAGAVELRVNISTTAANLLAAKNTFQVEYGQTASAYEPHQTGVVLDPVADVKQGAVMAGRSIVWVGDSIVKADGYKGWIDFCAEDYGAAVTNKGDNGATIGNIYPTVSCMSGSLLTYQFPSGADLVVFSGGTNDWERNISLGSASDMTSEVDTTVKGSLHKAISWVQTNHPSAKILILTPLERGDFGVNGAAHTVVNSLGLTLKDYRDAILDVVAAKSVPVCDNWGLSEVNRFTAEKFLYDGLHPDDLGYAVSMPLVSKNIEEVLS